MKNHDCKSTLITTQTYVQKEKMTLKRISSSLWTTQSSEKQWKTSENELMLTLVNDEKIARKLSAKPNLKHVKIFDENLVYCGMSILDQSKTLMYEFYYKCMKPKYLEKVKLLFTGTDSLAYQIKTEDSTRTSAVMLKKSLTLVISQKITSQEFQLDTIRR